MLMNKKIIIYMIFVFQLAFSSCLSAQINILPNQFQALPNLEATPLPPLDVMPSTGDSSGQLRLPEMIPKDKPGKRIYDVLKIQVNHITVRGNTVLSDDVILNLIRPYLNRYVSTAELQQLRYELSMLYVNQGYINSGVILPDQDVADGRIIFLVVEGKLNQIEVTNLKCLNKSYVLNQFRWDHQRVLDIKAIQNKLLLLQNNPLIEKFNAELLPGDTLGSSRLKMEITETKPFQVSWGVNNYRSPGVGPYYRWIALDHQNLTGGGNTLNLQYGDTQGMYDYLSSYGHFFSQSDITFKIFQQASKSTVIEIPFDELEINSRSYSSGFSVEKILTNTLQEKLTASITLEKRKSDTSLLGVPFSFSDGVINGLSRANTLRVTMEWTKRTAQDVKAVRTRVSFGIRGYDSTKNANGIADGSFVSVLSQFQWVKRLSQRNDQLIVRSDMQFASKPLLPMEKFAMGGACLSKRLS